MQKITSFTIDHLKLQPGVYVSRKDPVGDSLITTFDIRERRTGDEHCRSTHHRTSGSHLLKKSPGLRLQNHLLRTNGLPHRLLSPSGR